MMLVTKIPTQQQIKPKMFSAKATIPNKNKFQKLPLVISHDCSKQSPNERSGCRAAISGANPKRTARKTPGMIQKMHPTAIIKEKIMVMIR